MRLHAWFHSKFPPSIRASRLRMISAGAMLLVCAPTASHSQELPDVWAPSGACSALRSLRLPDVRLTEVEDVADSAQHGDNVRAPHCRVSGITGKAIAFTVVLPNKWNQRLLMGGNGGFAGSINRGILGSATSGYLTVSTNTGHDATSGGGARWALDDPERQLDFGFVAVHRTVELAKVLAKSFYGTEPRFSYFSGCSNGGRQALMEAQRYPDDFDGIVAGAPAAQFSTIGISFFKNTRAVFPDPGYFDKPIVTQANLDLVATKVLEACDALDGVRDGIIADPRDCTFRLSSVKSCPGDRVADDCVTEAQRKAIAAVYAPTRDAQGREIYPGQPVGGENLAAGWPAWITGRDTALMRILHVPSLQVMFMTEGAKYFTFADSAWDYSTYRGDFAKDSRRSAMITDAVNPDLDKFAARRGKLLLWHGWADPALNPLATIDYYRRVLALHPHARDNAVLFMAPGVLHCGGGAGPAPTEQLLLKAVTDWVERAQAPERLVVSRRDGAGKVTMTRPLCPYPQRAVYSGQGSTDDAANFTCREP